MAKKFIEFRKKFKEWMIYNKREELLGRLCYYARWKEWVFEAKIHTVWSHGCLRQIDEKLKELNSE